MKKVKMNLIDLQDTLILQENVQYNLEYIGKSKSDFKRKIEIIHHKPNIKSRISIKAIVFADAKFDLEAILRIDKGATSTDAYLKIDCLIVGDRSYARAIPSLEIKESEVKGGHGVTIGYIDENQLNYIYSKGINKVNAEKLLIKAFTKF